GRAFGMLMLFLPISAASSSILAKVQELTGSYAPALTGLSAICLLGGGAILFMRERHGGRPTAAEKTAAIEEAATPLV
ncbi:MAG TPA: hypothetical protein VJP88_01675, partial [Caulobacteraceae bacterium]|nr:hypothetical protein [Caulobacteraceae bacterium]